MRAAADDKKMGPEQNERDDTNVQDMVDTGVGPDFVGSGAVVDAVAPGAIVQSSEDWTARRSYNSN